MYINDYDKNPNEIKAHKFCVAPMLDWTDRHCRYFHRLISQHALLYTEMVTTGALIHGDHQRFLQFNPVENPVAFQLGGSNPRELAVCARMVEDYGYDEVNLNVGCPSDRVQKGRFGACLMKEPELEEERLTAAGRGMILEVTRQTMEDDPGNATVIAPSGETFEVPLAEREPGIFAGSAETQEIGLYQIGNGTLTALAHVGPVNAPEFADTVSTTEVLQPVTEASGGTIRRLETGLTGAVSVPDMVAVRAGAETAGRNWIGLRTTSDSVLRAVSRVPLFAGFLGLALLLLAMGSMWYREGR